MGCPEAKSGDGTLGKVGQRLNAVFGCQECLQKFDTGRALKSHAKFFHNGADIQVFRIIPILRDGDDLIGLTLGGSEAFRINDFDAVGKPSGDASTKARDFREKIAKALKVDIDKVLILEGGKELGNDHLISDLSATVIKQDMGLAGDNNLCRGAS